MADEKKGQPEIVLEGLEQVEDVRLDGNIKSGHAFICNHEIRAADQRSGNRDSLSLSS